MYSTNYHRHYIEVWLVVVGRWRRRHHHHHHHHHCCHLVRYVHMAMVDRYNVHRDDSLVNIGCEYVVQPCNGMRSDGPIHGQNMVQVRIREYLFIWMAINCLPKCNQLMIFLFWCNMILTFGRHIWPCPIVLAHWHCFTA